MDNEDEENKELFEHKVQVKNLKLKSNAWPEEKKIEIKSEVHLKL